MHANIPKLETVSEIFICIHRQAAVRKIRVALSSLGFICRSREAVVLVRCAGTNMQCGAGEFLDTRVSDRKGAMQSRRSKRGTYP
jgi:hypothetical protein